jgi:hypothetical protein
MTTEFDYRTLSAYVDGELDPGTISEIEAYLDHNREARQFVLKALGTTVRLRAASNKILHEPLPDRLVQTVSPSTATPPSWRQWHWPVFKLAAAFALLVLGVGLGFSIPRGERSSMATGFRPLPAAYEEAVNASLESHLSGDPLALETDDGRIVVTPIQTYRNRDGQYFRGYTMELVTDNARQTFKGMAYRTGPSQWRTTAIFMPRI